MQIKIPARIARAFDRAQDWLCVSIGKTPIVRADAVAVIFGAAVVLLYWTIWGPKQAAFGAIEVAAGYVLVLLILPTQRS